MARRLARRFGLKKNDNSSSADDPIEEFNESSSMEDFGLRTKEEATKKGEWDQKPYDQTNQRLFLAESIAALNLQDQTQREIFPIINPKLAFEFRKRWLMLKKKAKKNSKVKVKPTLVYHGTSRWAAERIAEGGFRIPQIDGGEVKNGALYGIGVYCSPDLYVAQSYAGGSVLVCVCLMGLSTKKKKRKDLTSKYKYDSYTSGTYYVIHDKYSILPLYFFKYPEDYYDEGACY